MSNVSILLVEDHPQLRRILVTTLSAMGYRVQAVSDADEALRQLSSGLTPDLVFTDIRMPGRINGLDLAWWVRSNRPNVVVLVHTGFSQEDTRDLAVLYKPYSWEALCSKLAELCPTAESAPS